VGGIGERLRRPAGALLTFLLVLGLSAAARSESASGVTEEDDEFAHALAVGDFDGDGRVDLAVGDWQEDIGGHTNAGAVNVIYSSPSGLKEAGNEVWYQGTVDIGGAPEDFDAFGSELATGDFDNDGFDDLAIGVIGEGVAGEDRAGAVNVIYGSGEGLTADGNQLLLQEEAKDLDRFGLSLAAGDFNNNGFDDLAVGAPGESLEGSGYGAGQVDRFFGSDGGLSETSNPLTQNTLEHDQSEGLDEFGATLAAGQLGAGPGDDLVIGVPREGFGSFDEGAVHVVYGGNTLQQFWHQNVAGIANTRELNDRFGGALAVGNFGHGTPADLAIGVPHEDVEVDAGEVNSAGAVHILYGTPETGLTEDNDQFWHQSKPGIANRIEPNDDFGSTLTTGDFGKSTHADLAVGVTGENFGSGDSMIFSAGVVNVLFGSADGIKAAGDQLWHQNVDGVKDSAETFDRWGSSLASGNFGSGSRADLAIGVPTEDLKGIEDGGAANVLYGTADGLSPAGDQFWHQTVP
jgi:FG-GAP repeat